MTPVPDRAKVIEAMARAIAAEFGFEWVFKDDGPDDIGYGTGHWCRIAADVLAALEAEGWGLTNTREDFSAEERADLAIMVGHYLTCTRWVGDGLPEHDSEYVAELRRQRELAARIIEAEALSSVPVEEEEGA